MRKLYLVLLCLVAAVTSLSAKQVWFDNSSTNWTTPEVYYWGGDNGLGSNFDDAKPMANVEGTTIYGYNVPDDIAGMKFRDLAGSGQSAGDITNIPEDGLWKGTATSNNGTYDGGDTPTPPTPSVDFPISSVSEIPAGMTLPTSFTPEAQIAGKTFHLVGANNLDETLTYNADYGCYVVITTLAGKEDWFKFNDGTWSTADYNLGSGDYVAYGSNTLYAAGGNCKPGDLADKKVLLMVNISEKLLYIPTNAEIKEALDAEPAIPTVYLRNEGDEWGYTPADWQLTSEDGGFTYSLTKNSVDANFEFLVSVDKTSVPFSQLTITGNVPVSQNYNNVVFPNKVYTNVTFTYTRATKSLEINGTAPVTPVVATWLPNSVSGWPDAPDADWSFSSEDGNIYTLGPIAEINGGFEFKISQTDNLWQDGFAVTGELKNYIDTKEGGNKVFMEGTYRNVTFTFNPEANTLQVDGKRVAQTGTITSGDYVLGNKFYIHYRNDADLNADWTVEEIAFDKWNGETNPNGLELHVFNFRANARTIPFYITNERGEVINAEKVFTLENFGTFGFPGTDEAEAMESCNSFQGLILGENYRVVCKIKQTNILTSESIATAQTHCLLGIFKPATTYSWGDTPQNLHIHGNLDGNWPALGVLGGIDPKEDTDGCANVTTGPEFTYNANTDIWYLDFKLGDAQGLNNQRGNGWEFTFVDEFGIQWYKADIELPYGEWTDGAMTVQTEDNHRNFYILDSEKFNSGETYRMQIRKNAATGVWQMRIVVKPEFNDALYIKSPENGIESPVVMPHAVDVEGNDIEGYYIYTMPYEDASKFQISKSDTDFDGQLIYAHNDQPACVLGTPYGIYDDGQVSEWSAEGTDLGMISVVVNYNTGALRVYSPSVIMKLASRHVQRIPGRFDGETYGVPASDLYNNVEGSSDEHPVTFDRVNSISVNLALTNLFFDRDCELTLTGLTVNGPTVENIAGRKFKLSDGAEGDKTAINNHIFHLPYSGHLTVDGQFDTTQPDYTFVLSYTISKNGLTKENSTTLVYEPNFQPYFVRPRPVADADETYTGSLLVQNAWLGNNNWAAIANRAIQFSGNTGDVDEDGNPIYYDYSGIPGQGVYDLSQARIGVYPGFKVTVDGVETENYHIPVGADKSNITKFYLANYGASNSAMDWSSAALAEGQLPVMVSLNSNTSADWLYEMQEGSRLTYQVFAHYPLYVFKGGVCADTFDEAKEVVVRTLESATPAAKAPAMRVTHTSTNDENGVCTIPDHVGVHSIVATRTFTGMTKLEQSTTGIEGVEAEAAANEAAPEYFNLQGIRVANPAPGNVYILRQGNTTTKVRL